MMERRSAYLTFGISALVLALAGAGLTLGIYFLDGPNESDTGSPYQISGPEVDDPKIGVDRNNDSTDPRPGVDIDSEKYTEPILGGATGPSQDARTTSNESGTPWFIYAAAIAALVAALLFVGISGRAYAESTRHESVVRNDLVDLISFNPGINLSSIRNELQLSQGAVSYHLRRLEKGGVIYSYKGMKERRFYPASMGYNQVENRSAADEVRSIIANPTGARIIEILGRGDSTQSQIVKEVGVSPSTVHWHMDRMEKVGIIRKRREGRTVIYGLSKALKDT